MTNQQIDILRQEIQELTEPQPRTIYQNGFIPDRRALLMLKILDLIEAHGKRIAELEQSLLGEI